MAVTYYVALPFIRTRVDPILAAALINSVQD